jgi:2-polyprenyl-3-methyl-5-hydroxy-6-metoxy-1,4-benzoquinol methylase
LTLIGKAEKFQLRFLPMFYNFHTVPSWHLDYFLCGDAAGKLRYTLGTPNSTPFYIAELEINLPFHWTVKLDNTGLWGNREKISNIESAIPRSALWLVGEFEFDSLRTGKLYRRISHRVRPQEGTYDENYFGGLSYISYEDDAAGLAEGILKLVQNYHPLTGRLLDVGCATGKLVSYAQSLGFDAHGVDCSSWAVEQANLRTQGSCRVLDFDHATIDDLNGPYDVLTMHSVLEHLSDPERTLRLLFDLCAEQGVVYLETLNADSIMHRLMKRDWSGYADYTHKSTWISLDWLVEHAQTVGFRILYLNCSYIWNDNQEDQVWRTFASMMQIYPLNVLLQGGLGDLVTFVLQKPNTKIESDTRWEMQLRLVCMFWVSLSRFLKLFNGEPIQAAAIALLAVEPVSFLVDSTWEEMASATGGKDWRSQYDLWGNSI